MIEIELVHDLRKMIGTRRENGRLISSKRFDPHSVTQQEATARLLGITSSDLLAHYDAAPVKWTPGGAKSQEITVFIRNLVDSRGAGISGDPQALLISRLSDIPTTHVLDWSGLSLCCCLDIDYHDIPAPSEAWLESIFYTRISPKPLVWHLSRSGGIHAFYVASEGFSADELASIAALRFRMIDPTAGVELKSQVRGPGESICHWTPGGQDTSGGLSEWLGVDTADELMIRDWMESEGVEFGSRYDHTHCPIHSSPDEPGAKRDPVSVSESGIFCFLCQGKGRSIGSRTPGFAPWSAILGCPSSGEIGRMIRNLTHWGHAKWVLQERLKLPANIAPFAYRGALKSYHAGKATESLIPSVFSSDTDCMSRVNDKWVNPTNGHTYKDHKPLLAALPCAQYVNEKGEIKASQPRVIVLNQTDPEKLSSLGYDNIHVIHGCKLTAQYLDCVSSSTVLAVPAPELTRAGSRYLPRYVEAKDRTMTEDQAWQELELIFPGMDRTLIRLLICATGCAQETKLGITPFLFIAGVSGSAKSSHPQIAAAIVGTKAVEPVFTSDNERFRQSIREGLGSGPILVINEVIKEANRSRNKLTPTQALEPILTLTEDSLSHELFRGPTKLGRPFVAVFTDVLLPQSVYEDVQIARRLRYYRVVGRKDEWTKTRATAGLGNIHNLRLLSPRIADACNVILSSVIDKYFSLPSSFDVIADALGVPTLERSPDFDDPTALMRRFFQLVCFAPEISETYKKKYKGDGYKRICKSEDHGDLVDVYTAFADGTGGDWVTSRKLTAMDWSKILGVTQPVEFILKSDGSAVYVRFIVGAPNKPTSVNQGIIDPTKWET